MNSIDAFQLDVHQAYLRFVAEVAAAGRRVARSITEATLTEAVDRLRHALAVPPASPSPADVLPAVDRARRAIPQTVREKREQTARARREKVLAAIRANPGCATAQLVPALSINASTLDQLLNGLIREGAIRAKRGISPISGYPCKLYFVAEVPEPAPQTLLNSEAAPKPATTEALE